MPNVRPCLFLIYISGIITFLFMAISQMYGFSNKLPQYVPVIIHKELLNKPAANFANKLIISNC